MNCARIHWTRAFACAVAVAVCLACSLPAAGLELPSRISILVGFGPGQGNDQPARPEAAALAASRMSPDMTYDQTARLLARHMGRFLPGSPRVEAQHAPGAAGLVTARRLSNAPGDGGVIALLSSNVIYSSALALPGADIDVEKLIWIGGVAADAWACIRTRASLASSRAWAGTLGAGSRADVHARAMRDIAGYPFDIAAGYVSRFEIVRAIETGEIDAACGWPLSDLKRRRSDWFATDRMTIIAMFSRSPDWSSAPAPGLSGASDAVMEALAAEAELAWPVAAPPGTSAGVATAFRKALEALSHDRAAMEDAISAGIELDPVDADTIRARVRALHALDEATADTLKSLYKGGR